MLTLDEKKFILTTDDGDIIAVYLRMEDAKTDGKHLAESRKGTKIHLRELDKSATEDGILSKSYVLKESFEVSPEKEEEKGVEKKEEAATEGGEKAGTDEGEAKGAAADPGEGEHAKEDQKVVGAPAGKEGETSAEETPVRDCCPDCGNPVAPGAEFCPACGCKAT